MGAHTLGRWIGRMVAVAAVSAGASLGAVSVIDAEPNHLSTIAEATPDADEQAVSPAGSEWQ